MALCLDDFIAAYTGKVTGAGTPWPCSGFPAGQCTALACLWCENLGLTTPCGYCGAPDRCDGVCWSGGSYPGWEWIANDPTNVPSPGDLVAYHKCSEQGIGPNGHVDIFVSGNVDSFTSFAQNWGGQYAHLVAHNYACVLGWHHPTGGVPGCGASSPPASSASPPASSTSPPQSSASPPASSAPTSAQPPPAAPCPPGYEQVGSFCYPPTGGPSSSAGGALLLAAAGLAGAVALRADPGLRRQIGSLRLTRPSRRG